jgi:hypothetical protein
LNSQATAKVNQRKKEHKATTQAKKFAAYWMAASVAARAAIQPTPEYAESLDTRKVQLTHGPAAASVDGEALFAELVNAAG